MLPEIAIFVEIAYKTALWKILFKQRGLNVHKAISDSNITVALEGVKKPPFLDYYVNNDDL
jgi:hypothetical protein